MLAVLPPLVEELVFSCLVRSCLNDGVTEKIKKLFKLQLATYWKKMLSIYKKSLIKCGNHHLFNYIANIVVKGEMSLI